MKQVSPPLDRIEIRMLTWLIFDPPQTIPEKLRWMRDACTYKRYFYARLMWNDVRNSLFPISDAAYVYRANEAMCN